jgi:hypothetical protein
MTYETIELVGGPLDGQVKEVGLVGNWIKCMAPGTLDLQDLKRNIHKYARTTRVNDEGASIFDWIERENND